MTARQKRRVGSRRRALLVSIGLRARRVLETFGDPPVVVRRVLDALVASASDPSSREATWLRNVMTKRSAAARSGTQPPSVHGTSTDAGARLGPPEHLRELEDMLDGD